MFVCSPGEKTTRHTKFPTNTLPGPQQMHKKGFGKILKIKIKLPKQSVFVKNCFNGFDKMLVRNRC